MIALSDSSSFSLAIGLHTTLFGIRGLAGPWIGTLLYSCDALSLNAIFWLIAALLSFGAVMMMLFARSVPHGKSNLRIIFENPWIAATMQEVHRAIGRWSKKSFKKDGKT